MMPGSVCVFFIPAPEMYCYFVKDLAFILKVAKFLFPFTDFCPIIQFLFFIHTLLTLIIIRLCPWIS